MGLCDLRASVVSPAGFLSIGYNEWFKAMMRFFVVVLAAAAVLCLASCKHAPPAGVAAEVNGDAITFTELEKTYLPPT